MLTIAPGLTLDEKDLSYDYIRASGPGGQNVNKVSTAVQLRFALEGSAALPTEVKERLKRLAGSHLTQAGEVLIEAKRYRTQEQNRLDAEQRLIGLIQKAMTPPKPRHPTRPTTSSIIRRADTKRRRSAIKRIRSGKPGLEE